PDEGAEAVRGGLLVAVEAQLPLDARTRLPDGTPEVEGGPAVGVGVEVEGRDAGLLDDEGDGARALRRLAGRGEFVEGDVGRDDEGGLAARGARGAPLEGLAQREGAAVAGVLDLIGAHGPGEPELLGNEGRQGPAHVLRGLRAHGDEADAIEAPIKARQ